MPHPAVDPTAAALADPVPADHAAHDAVLVAAFAAGDAEGAELEAATALVTACAACTTLHHDLRAIAAALPLVPAPARTRDFRLTPGQAASLRPAGWRRLLAPFAGPRFAFAAPLGSGLAALGVVGILLAGTGLPLSGATAGVAPAEGPLVGAAPTADDGSVAVTEVTAAPAAPSLEIQAPVAAPQGGAGAEPARTGDAGAAPAASGETGAAPAASGAATTATDKNAAFGPDASAEPVAGAAANSSPAEAPAGSGEAARAMGARDQVAGGPANVVLLALAAALLLVGVALAGLRVLSRRLA